MSVTYAEERRQFGVPIGTFQAVKHHLANALLGVEFAAPAVLRAAWSLDTGAATADRDVAMAKALASDAAERVAATALPGARGDRLHDRVRPPPLRQAGVGRVPQLGHRGMAAGAGGRGARTVRQRSAVPYGPRSRP